jgi:hypothetical protein
VAYTLLNGLYDSGGKNLHVRLNLCSGSELPKTSRPRPSWG